MGRAGRHGPPLLTIPQDRITNVSHADLTAARWQELPEESALNVARSIARENQMALVEVRDHDYAGRRRRIALFERAGMRFSLVPGDRVTLGYDGARFVPTPEQAADYADSAREYGLPSMAEFIEGMTSPQRVADLPATLVGVEPMDIWTPKDNVEFEFNDAGLVSAVRVLEETTAFRVEQATPDEWEYACGAGARTLFRWGDDTPGDDDPWSLPAGPHRKPNLWGLMIGQNPYRHEWTEEPGVICGGDGGSAVCGGYGVFWTWLTLATAFRDREFGEWVSSDDGFIDELLIRPVVRLR